MATNNSTFIGVVLVAGYLFNLNYINVFAELFEYSRSAIILNEMRSYDRAQNSW